MFGYVTPLKSELKFKEFEYFRSYYCGLCNEIKREYGNICCKIVCKMFCETVRNHDKIIFIKVKYELIS